MTDPQETQNRKAAQQTRRLRERLATVEKIQDAHLDITVDHETSINDHEERLRKLEGR